MDRHYDLTYLNQVFHGNEAMIHEIVRLFLEQAPRFGVDMLTCLDEARWSDLHPIAHRMKSSVTMLGMQSLIPLVLEVERKSKFQEHGEALADLVHSLNRELRVVCEVLQSDAREATTRSSSRRLRRA